MAATRDLSEDPDISDPREEARAALIASRAELEAASSEVCRQRNNGGLVVTAAIDRLTDAVHDFLVDLDRVNRPD